MDTVLRGFCHEISRDIAVQQTQQYYKKTLAVACVGLVAAIVTAGSTGAGIATRGAPQPILGGSATGPCDPRLDGPDYVPGVDVNGNPVAPADLATARNPVPDGALVPLKQRRRHARSGESPVVALDGRTLDPILNPDPACPPGRR